MKIMVLNGPNLNLIGRREPEIYGTQSLDDFLAGVKKRFPQHEIDTFQTNHEGVLIDKLHEAMGKYDGIVMNPGGYAHTSIALADAVRAIAIPVVEVHISNIFEREAFRHHSYTAEAAVQCIVGHGLNGYIEAIEFFNCHLSSKAED
jgi:3-dehydroquinate dehydratase-2